MEYQLSSFRHYIEGNFIDSVGWSVVVRMCSVKVEDNWNTFFGKVVVVGTIVETVSVVRIVITIVHIQVGICDIGKLRDHLQWLDSFSEPITYT